MGGPLGLGLQVLVFLVVPLAALGLARWFRVARAVGPVVLSYGVGIALANLPGLAPAPGVARVVSEAAVPLALPLILFGSELQAWWRTGRSALLSFGLAVVAAAAAAFAAARLLGSALEEGWKISGMLVGVYTGGTPNLVSIGMALGAHEETYVLVNASDAVAGAVYLLFLMTLAKPLLARIFPAFDPLTPEPPPPPPASPGARGRGMAVAFLLSALIVGVSAGLTWAVVGSIAVAGVFLGLTTGGVLASLIPRVRALPGSQDLGQYLILVFCVAMGARTDLTQLASAGSVILLYTAAVMFGAILLHFVAARVAGIDVDTLLITSTAAVYGPAFVVPVAEAIRNRRVVLSGLTAGLVGYAVGNYVGLALAWLVRP